MNNLTWFLYLTSFPEKIGGLTLLGFILAIIGAFTIFASILIKLDRLCQDNMRANSDNYKYTLEITETDGVPSVKVLKL